MTIVVKSKNQLLGDILRSLAINTDLSVDKIGSGITTLAESLAQRQFQLQLSVLKILEQKNIDALTGSDLDQAAADIKLPNGIGGIGRIPASPSSGSVMISSSFSKLSTTLYAGKPAPFVGNTQIYVTDASKWASTGSLYIGRGTLNSFEGPVRYLSLVNNQSYWSVILDPSTPLTKPHKYADSIIVSQGGDRKIPAGFLVTVPASTDFPQVTYTTNSALTIPDGEDCGTVAVTCTQFGSIGNATLGAISQFTAPFNGAKVSNTTSFINGFDIENDSSLRQRIKDYPSTLAKGTDNAIKSILQGLKDLKTGKTITSVSVIPPTTATQPSQFYIDDGSGLEPIFASQNYELLLAQANGQETNFNTALTPVAPSVLIGATKAPYALLANEQITFILDGVAETYTVTLSNYKDLRTATAYEIVRDFNSQAQIFAFRTTSDGSQVVAFDNTGNGEIMSTLSGAIQSALGLPLTQVRPLYLYKNSILQSFKGKTATLTSVPFAAWSSVVSLSSGPLMGTIAIDGISVTFSITASDFVKAGVSGISNSSVQTWASILQSKIPGVKVSVSGGSISIQTNRSLSSLGSLQVLVDSTQANSWTQTVFNNVTLSDVGIDQQYTFNRFTGEIHFLQKLTAGDVIEVASLNTRGFVQSKTITSGLVDLSSGTNFGSARFVTAFDGSATIRQVLIGATSSFSVSTNNAENLVSISSDINTQGNIFLSASVGDYIYLVRDASQASSLPSSCEGIYLIKKISSPDGASVASYTLEIEVSTSQLTAFNSITTPISVTSGMVSIFASTAIPQIITLSGLTTSSTIDQVVAVIQSQIVGGTAVKASPQALQIHSNLYSASSTIAILAVIGNASNLLSPAVVGALQAHTAFSESSTLDQSFPIVSNVLVPGLAYQGQSSIAALQVERNLTNIIDTGANPSIQASSQISTYPIGFQETWLTGKNVGLTGRVYNNNVNAPFPGIMRGDQSNLRPLQTFNSNPQLNRYSNLSLRFQDLPLTNTDKFVVEFDNNPATETVSVPMSKHAQISDIVSVPAGQGSIIQFHLKDPDDLGKPFFDTTSAFKVQKLFEDFRMLTRSVGVYKRIKSDGGPNADALVVRSSQVGGANKIALSILPPSDPNQSKIAITHANAFNGQTVETFLTVKLASGAPATNTTFKSGTYSVAVGSTSNNIRTITLDSHVAATSASVYSGFGGGSPVVYMAASSGTVGNGIQFTIINSGNGNPTISQVTTPGSQSFTINTNGTPGITSTQLQTIINSTFPGTALISVSGAGSFPVISSTVTTAGGTSSPTSSTTSAGFGTITYTATASGTAGNGIQVLVVDTSTASPVVTQVNTAGTKSVTVDTRGNLNLSAAQVQTAVTVATGGTNLINISGSGTFPLSNSTVVTAGGTDAQTGMFSSAFIVGNVLKIGGSSLISGSFMLTSSGFGTVSFGCPDFNGISSLNGSVFDAAINGINSFPLLSKTVSDLATAINAYLPNTPIASAQAIGTTSASTQVAQPSYLNYSNSNTLPLAVTDLQGAIRFHAFRTQDCGYAGIFQYDTQNYIQATVQTSDSIFPTSSQTVGTSYSPAGEDVYLVPSNAATLERWFNLAAISPLSLSASAQRIHESSGLQLSSLQHGSLGTVEVKSTSANDLTTFVQSSSSVDSNSNVAQILLSNAEALPKGSLVKVSNTYAAELQRPYQVSSGDQLFLGSGNSILYRNVNGTRGRLYFQRNGQGGTEPLHTGSGETIKFSQTDLNGSSLPLGMVRVTYASASGGKLAARAGDMMFVRNDTSSGFPADIVCAPLSVGQGNINNEIFQASQVLNHGYTRYIGYPVVYVEDQSHVIILAPNMSTFLSSGYQVSNSTDVLFLPALHNEKNIQTFRQSGAAWWKSTGSPLTLIVKKLGGGFASVFISNSTTELTDNLQLSEMMVNTDDYAVLDSQHFSAKNSGTFRIIAHNSRNHLVVYNPSAEDQLISTTTVSHVTGTDKWGIGPFSYDGTTSVDVIRILDAESVQLGQSIRISGSTSTGWVNNPALIGIFKIADMGYSYDTTLPGSYSLCPYIDFDMPNGAPGTSSVNGGASIPVGANNTSLIGFIESIPFSSFRIVQGIAVNTGKPTNADVYLAPSKSVQKISNVFGTSLTSHFKLGFPQAPLVGIDGYKIFDGIIRLAHNTVDGVPSNSVLYPGVKASGPKVEILPPLLRSCSFTLKVRPKDGVSLNTIADVVRTVVANYVNTLAVGQPVILSEIVAVVQPLSGVQSVEITASTPAAVDVLISVAQNEKAIVIDASTDISVG